MTHLVKQSLPRVARLLPRLKGRRIGVLGDFMLDRYLWGDASKLSPEVPVPVVTFEKETGVLGGAGNVAANLAALGAVVTAFGVVGEDTGGKAIRACLREAHIDDKPLVSDASRPTTVKTRVIARKHQIVRIDHERTGALSSTLESRLLRLVVESLPKLDGLVLSDYDKGVLHSDSFAD